MGFNGGFYSVLWIDHFIYIEINVCQCPSRKLFIVVESHDINIVMGWNGDEVSQQVL